MGQKRQLPQCSPAEPLARPGGFKGKLSKIRGRAMQLVSPLSTRFQHQTFMNNSEATLRRRRQDGQSYRGNVRCKSNRLTPLFSAVGECKDVDRAGTRPSERAPGVVVARAEPPQGT